MAWSDGIAECGGCIGYLAVLEAKMISRCQAEHVCWPLIQCPYHRLLGFDDRNEGLKSCSPQPQLGGSILWHEVNMKCKESVTNPHHMTTVRLILAPTGRGQIPSLGSPYAGQQWSCWASRLCGVGYAFQSRRIVEVNTQTRMSTRPPDGASKVMTAGSGRKTRFPYLRAQLSDKHGRTL